MLESLKTVMLPTQVPSGIVLVFEALPLLTPSRVIR